MRQAIAGRELVTLDGAGVRMRGTFHKPASTCTETASRMRAEAPIGIMLLNAFLSPRAAFGDTAVEWADAFAEAGYPSFRFDLPGLGDSEGETPSDLLSFINEGGYAAVTCAKARELVDKYKLGGLILVGHCAAAVTAAFAAAGMPECKGLIIMDPYFHVARSSVPAKLKSGVVDWVKRNGVGPLLGGLRDHGRAFKRSLLRNTLPRNANRMLLARWQQLLENRLPVLVLRARDSDVLGDLSRPGHFDYLRYLGTVGGGSARLTVNVVDDTDHCFANDEGRAAVKACTQDWLADHFPIGESVEIEAMPVYPSPRKVGILAPAAIQQSS